MLDLVFELLKFDSEVWILRAVKVGILIESVLWGCLAKQLNEPRSSVNCRSLRF